MSPPMTAPLAPLHRDDPDRAALAVLRETFGFESFRTGQDEAIGALLRGGDVLAVMPTGSGKSLCFQIPALLNDGIAIVVSPLVALMQNQVAGLRLSGISAATINSSIPRDDNVATWRQVQSGSVKLLYLSPERLMTERMLDAVARLKPSLIAIDEAHCISQWGPAFRPEYEGLRRLRGLFPGVPIVALTATADPATRDDIADKIFSGNVTTIVTGFDRPNLTLAVAPKQGWKRQMLDYAESRRGQSGIVYCLSRRKTEEAAEALRDAGHNALAYHAGMEAAARTAVQDRFMTEPGLVIAATIAFGMGIDKPDIRYVFHTDLPGSPEAYYQEIGRAGRDGEPAETMMLYGLDDIRMRRLFIEQEDSSPERKRREHKRLESLLSYCESAECRRRALLTYFGEESGPCGNCDVCLNPVPTVDATADAQTLLAAVQKTGQRYGAAHIVDIVTGKTTEKVTSAGHDRLPVFGAGAGRKPPEWHAMARQLVAGGYLALDVQGHGGLSLGERGAALLRGAEEFRFHADAVPRAGGTRTRKSAAASRAGDLTADGQRLLQRLKDVRLELAHERGVPAYVIFSDKSLVDMALRRPANRAEFAQVFGVGKAKLDEFADLFLRAIRDFAEGA